MSGRLFSLEIPTPDAPRDLPGLALVPLPAVYVLGAKLF